MNDDIRKIHEEVEKAGAFVDALFAEIGKVIVGQDYLIERLLMSLLADGHVLIEGVPGLAKTLAVRTLSAAINTDYQRIQFTPDLLPADLTGTLIYNQRSGEFTTRQGPIFSNIILADEINRAPAKVQSALLEAMQERQVTIGEKTFSLPELFLVLATQNPIEQEGTYPLPEAQIDRFMFKLKVSYPNKNEELEIIKRFSCGQDHSVRAVVQPDDILKARSVLNRVYVDEKIYKYIVELVFASRDPVGHGLKDNAPLIQFGASPRASLYLTIAAKAHAFLKHRGYVIPEDVRIVGADVLRHRIIVSYEAEAEEITADMIIQNIFDHIEVP